MAMTPEYRLTLRVKQHGHLLGFNLATSWQYWLLDDAIYVTHSSGDPTRTALWCTLDRLSYHLRRLERVTGHKLTDDVNFIPYDKDFLRRYAA